MTHLDLRDTLHANELTGHQAAHLLGVAPRTVRSWLAGDREIPATVERLLLALRDIKGFRAWLETTSRT